jgi:hypothetical protein
MTPQKQLSGFSSVEHEEIFLKAIGIWRYVIYTGWLCEELGTGLGDAGDGF